MSRQQQRSLGQLGNRRGIFFSAFLLACFLFSPLFSRAYIFFVFFSSAFLTEQVLQVLLYFSSFFIYILLYRASCRAMGNKRAAAAILLVINGLSSFFIFFPFFSLRLFLQLWLSLLGSLAFMPLLVRSLAGIRAKKEKEFLWLRMDIV